MEEVRATRIAAAKKKLKEYQKKVLSVTNNNLDQNMKNIQNGYQENSTTNIKLFDQQKNEGFVDFYSVSPNAIKTTGNSNNILTSSIKENITQPTLRLFDPSQYFNNNSNNPQDEISSLILRMNELNEQLHLQAKSLELLVEEKSNLKLNLELIQKDLNAKNEQIENLQNTIKLENNHSSKLSQEICDLKDQCQNYEKEKSSNDYIIKELNEELKNVKQQLELQNQEIQELSSKLSEKCEQLTNSEKSRTLLDADLKMAQLNLQQLSFGTDQSSQHELENLQRQNKELTYQLEFLNVQVKQLKDQKCDITQEYESQLDSFRKGFEIQQQEFQKTTVKNATLHDEMQKYLEKMSETENTLRQLENTIQVLTNENVNLEAKLELFKNGLDELSAEKENLLKQIEEQTKELFELRENQSHQNNILLSLESEKVASSRAIQQNRMLKEQLLILQNSLVEINNEKCAIVDHLKNEQQLSLDFKEKFRKQPLSEGPSCHLLKQQLEEMQNQISALSDQNSTLKTLLSRSQNVEEIQRMQNDILHFQTVIKSCNEEIRQLTVKNSDLEHLIIQLQGETETIEEYIALYRLQRGLLTQRTEEKDKLIMHLTKEKEILVSKLDEFRELINATGENFVGKSEMASLLCDIESTLEKEILLPESFHSCMYCSGHLLTV